MTVGTRSGGDSLRKQQCRVPLLRALDEKSTKLQHYWNAKTEVMANKIDRHGVGEADWIESIQECPVYYPTKEDFAEDPLRYIQKVAAEASKYGMCKIVSPVVASVPAGMVLNKEQSGFRFSTRLQPMRLSNWEKDDKIAFPIKGRHYTLTEYEKVANRVFSRKFSTAAGLPPRFIESEFWKELVAGKTRTVEYATDVDGSAFSTSKTDPLGQSKWNLKGISRLPNSILRLLEESIPGVTEPMLYVGMLFSMFAWHIEDHYLYSINYQHCGAPKTWYGVPGGAASLLEKVVKEHVYSRELLSDTGKGAELDLLLEKTTMFAPKLLTDHGVPVFKAVQYPGEFVVTFPRAYHAGFSHGFNCGEAVNFAMADWFPFGAEACLRYEFLNRFPLLPHDELLCKEATIVDGTDQSGYKDSSCQQQACVKMAFVAMMQSHQQVKSGLERQGARMTTATVVNLSCGLCKHKCYVAYTRCKCFDEPTCFNHGDIFSSCSCEGDRLLVLRSDFANLQLVAQKYEREEEMRKQAQKVFLDNDTIEQGDGAPSGVMSECMESSLLTNAMSSREACDKREDKEDACSENIFFQSDTRGVFVVSDCRQEQEEDESDTGVLRIKRRRVASPQSKRFQVDEQEIAEDKSSVRSLESKISLPVRGHDGLDKKEDATAPLIKRGEVSVHQVIHELNIKGSATEVISQWESDARRQGMILKVQEVTIGQESVKVLTAKSLCCLKRLVSREEAKVIQKLMWEVESRRDGNGQGNPAVNLASLDKQSRVNESQDGGQSGESSKKRKKSLGVTDARLTVTSEECVSPGDLHSDCDKKCSAESLGAFSSIAGSTIFCDETRIQVVQDLKVSGGSVSVEAAPEVKDAVQTTHLDSRMKDAPCDPESTRAEGGSIGQEDCSSSEAVNMEPDTSAPLTESVAVNPVAAVNLMESRDISNTHFTISSAAAELETCKFVTSHIDNADIGYGLGQGTCKADKGSCYHVEQAETQPPVDLEVIRERNFEAKPGGDATAELKTLKSVTPHTGNADMGNGLGQGTGWANEGSGCHVEQAETQPPADLEVIRERNFETNLAGDAKPLNDCDKPELTRTSSCVPKRGLVIHLNRKVDQSLKKAAITHDQNKNDNEFDQVDIFEGEDAWFLDQKVMCSYSGRNEGEPILPLECFTSVCSGDILQPRLECDDAQECFAEKLDLKADKFLEEAELSVLGHQHGKSVDSQDGNEFPLGEFSGDVTNMCSNFEPYNCAVGNQIFTEEQHRSGVIESINFGKRQKIELPCEVTNEVVEELSAGACTSEGNYAECFHSVLDAHVSRFTYSSHSREDVVDKPSYKTQSYGLRADSSVGHGTRWGCPPQGHYDFSFHHRTGHTASRNNSDRFKGVKRSSPGLHQERHPYHRDTHRSMRYPRVFCEKEQVPRSYWKRRPNRHCNGGWRDANNTNTSGGDSHRINGVFDRQMAGCATSTSQESVHVEGYDPVKWEIAPSAKFWQSSSMHYHVPPLQVDRGL